MQITFKNKKMIVKHPTGVVCEYDSVMLERERNSINSKIEDLKEDLDIVNEQIVSLNNSRLI